MCDYNSGYLYSEFTPSTLTFYVGQYPARLTQGQTYTISQAMRYRKSLTHYANARFIFNITVGNTSSATLRTIDYDDPTVGVESIVNEDSRTKNDIYDLNGRRVSSSSLHHAITPSLPKGIYIKGGKKIVVK